MTISRAARALLRAPVPLWSCAAIAVAAVLAPLIAAPPGPHVVFLIQEDEYRTDESLPAFARDELAPRGFRTTILVGDPSDPGRFPGMEAALEDADVVVLSVRRRALPAAQLASLRAYLEAGKPLIALRTSSHAFALRDDAAPPAGRATWPAFDTEVLGARYEGHFRNPDGTEVHVRPEAGGHPLLRGVRPPSFHSGGTLYRSRELGPSTEVLLEGRATDGGNEVTEPVAWTNEYRGARIFYTSLGHPADLAQKPFRRLLVNAVYWGMGEEVPAFAATDRAEVEAYMREFPKRAEASGTAYLSPTEALKHFVLAPGIEQDLVASEPTIYQPVEISFDHRGRLWVVQYNQYPHPEGLKIRGYDEWLRAVFDTVPAPPPHHEPGADRITVLEDTDGDGVFESARDVITGLNLATSVALGRGGVWVLNPPYLLKYPDPDGDGTPDGEPEVHLSGFGLEDTHAVANSLHWGPDGWLYGAHGSTTTADVSSAATRNVRWEGQGIWRYHPATRVFELFAEGGGNTFNVEFDAKGRLYSGHNGGNARVFYYKQGGYYRKGWGKHGGLTNPYAFGHFPHVPHTGDRDRFTHAQIVYEEGVLPEGRFAGRIISVNPLHGRVEVSRLDRVGSTFRTTDVERLVDTQDGWYRPVDIQEGPDGAVYIADWYDARINHVDPRDDWHRASGRIYRIRAPGASPAHPFDLSRATTDELIALLRSPSKWRRQEALRLLGDRSDRGAIPKLAQLVREETGQLALEALWALNLSGGFDEAFAAEVALKHRDPHVRRWTVRLLADGRDVSPETAARLASLAVREPDVEVRSQLAASARRLPGQDALPILRALLAHDEDAADPEIPLELWWALEAHAESARAGVLALFEGPALWGEPLVQESILPRLMQRYVAAGGEANLRSAAALLQRAPSELASQRLVQGLLQALRGTELTDAEMPPELAAALRAYEEKLGSSDLTLGLRQGRPEAVSRALELVADPNADPAMRLAYLEILGEVHQPDAVPVLLKVMTQAGPASAPIQRAALQALARYDDPRIGLEVATVYPDALRSPPAVRAAALELLSSRPEWAAELIGIVKGRRVRSEEIPAHVVEQLALYGYPDVARLWPGARPATSAEKSAEIARAERALRGGAGDAAAGKRVYAGTCGACHRLAGKGGTIGPDLTGYDRRNTADLLLHIVDPSAYIREGYVSYLVRTRDSRSLTGYLSDQSGGRVVVQSLSGAETTIPRELIREIRPSPVSPMPERLLAPLDQQEIRDLFEYLRTAGGRGGDP